MSRLIEQIKQKDVCAFTHGGKFHADDVFSSALLLYINPEISITRGNSVPDDFTGIVFDIGRGEFDHHQKDSRIRENGVPYAAFGLLWESVGADILGEELAVKFDESFVQPLDNNDNTGEKNELATLIGNFNPSWDYEGGSDEAFFQAVSVAGMILENKFERYRGNERADKRVEEVLAKHDPASRILVLPEFIPCQKALSETDIAFVIFPSNRGGFCIQPQKREYSMNYKCSFPAEWLGLEGEELVNATGISGAIFCHKGGFIMTVKLGFITAEYLFSHHRNFPEGELTRLRSYAVCEKSLFEYAKEINLGDRLLLGKGEEMTGGRTRPSVVSDAFEAVIAAIYIDGGIGEAKKFVLRFVEPYVEAKPSFKDYKTILQEVVQKNQGESLKYVLVSESGPDHDKHFKVEVHLNSNVIGAGVGSSKKKAEQAAAKEALELMGI